MENVSRQSKQKRQTSKKGSQAKKTNGHDTSQERRVRLTVEQSGIFKQLIQSANEAQAQLNFALVAAGLSEELVIGGDLDVDEPYLIVKNKLVQ